MRTRAPRHSSHCPAHRVTYLDVFCDVIRHPVYLQKQQQQNEGIVSRP